MTFQSQGSVISLSISFSPSFSLSLFLSFAVSLSLSALKKVGKDNEGVGVSVVSHHLITLACNQLQGDVWPCQSLMCLQLRVRNYCWSTAPSPLLSLHPSVSNSRDWQGRGSGAEKRPEGLAEQASGCEGQGLSPVALRKANHLDLTLAV